MQIDPTNGSNGVPGIDRTDTAATPARPAGEAITAGASSPPPAVRLDGMLKSSLRAMAAAAAADASADLDQVETSASNTAALIAGGSATPGTHQLDALRVRGLLSED